MAGHRSAPRHPVGLLAPLALYLSAVAYRAIERSVTGWRHGIPRYEIALLNRVTEPFNGLSLTLADPFGFLGPYLHISSELHQLHARGGTVPGQPSGSDAYGADLAVTVDVRPYPRIPIRWRTVWSVSSRPSATRVPTSSRSANGSPSSRGCREGSAWV